MDSIVINVDETTIKKMRKFYDSQMVVVDDANILFKAQIIGCSITAHTSNEVSFKGIRAQETALKWQNKKKKSTSKKPNNLVGPFLDSHIGSDDVGNADYFGPICTVACYVEDKDIPWLSSLMTSNVKTMPATEVVKIAREIKDKIKYSLLILDNPHYNKMVNEGNNPTHIKAKLHNQAITNVMQRLETPVETKVVEYFVASKTYYNYLKNEVIVVKNLNFEKNTYSRYMAMSCAHILARYASLQYLNNMSKSLKVKLPYGNNSIVEKVAVQLVKTHGEGILNKIAKKNFPNTKRVLEAMK